MSGLAIVLVTRPEAALRRVAGLTLLERVVRTAAAGGGEVVVTADEPGVMSALGGRVTARFERPESLASSLAVSGGSVTLWLAHHVYDRSATMPTMRAKDAAALVRAEDGEVALHGAPRSDAQLNEQVVPSIDASTDAGARAATEALWQSCRKPIDGVVSRNLNRHISLAISRRIVDTGITPNHVSVLCIALGLLSGVLAAQGGYGYLLAGAAAFKLNSILDGVDGELARVRWAYSKVGELLDSAGDNLANFSFFGGVTVAAARAGQDDLATAGAVGLTLWALYLAFLYSRLSGTGRGDVMQVRTSLDELPSPLVTAALTFGRTFLRRDSFVMLSFLAAVVGYAPHLLLMVLVGGSTVFAYAVLHFAARLLRPAAALEVDSR
jgi:CDP-L-myo-inositol myo-inositolphosphotransferase